MPISFDPVGTFSGVKGTPSVLTGPTSLQFGPDGRLYVSEQNGSINAFTVEFQNGKYFATAHELLKDSNGNEIVQSIQNHFDDGTEKAVGGPDPKGGGTITIPDVVNRQVTGIAMAGTEINPVLFISSSDPAIAQNGEEKLDTNSGVVTRATWTGTEWEVIDLVRGLPRSEENHSVNGMLLSEDGTKLLLQVGGFTNSGAPSSFFSYIGEYVLSGSILELDLEALEALPTRNDPQGGQGDTPRAYKYDLPTLDDPNRANAPGTVTQAFVQAAAALQASNIGQKMNSTQLAAFGIVRVANAAPGTFPAADVVITQELFNVFKAIKQNRIGDDFTDAEAIAAGFQENAAGLDLNGPWGGNDGLNQAILPADAPLRLYADGLRNPYDLARTLDGKIYTVDNGGNKNLGNFPKREPASNDLDGDGIKEEAINTPNNGGSGEGEPLFLIKEGAFYQHANPVRSNQNMSWTVYNDSGNPDGSVAVNTVANISALVPDAVNIADGFLIDPSKFAVGPGQTLADLSKSEQIARLYLSGQGKNRDNSSLPIDTLGSSTNGVVAYNSGGMAFNGVLDGKLFVTQFNDNVTLLNINADGTALIPILEEGPDGIYGTADDVVQAGGADGILEVANNSLGVALANPLDVTVGPNGTLWVAEIGGSEITVLAPSNILQTEDTDSDDDGIENVNDPFLRDASNATSVVVAPGQPTVWEFSQGAGNTTPGPDGFGGGLTGVMIDGKTNFEAFLQSFSPRDGQIIQLDNVKFVTAAGGGTTTIEEVTNGDPLEGQNDGQFFFHTGFKLADNVETFTIKWVVSNPGAITDGSDITTDSQQIGGYIGDGTQSNYLKIVAIATNDDASTASIQIALENGDTISQIIDLPANDIFNSAVLATDSAIVFELEINPGAATAIPKATYTTTTGDITITGGPSDVIYLTGSAVLNTILGNNTVQGQTTGIAAGLFASNMGSSTDTFQAVFDSITVTATEAQVAPSAVDDTADTGVNTVLSIPVADLLANDTDPNPADTLIVTSVGNATNGTVLLNDGGTPGNTSDDFVTFTPANNFTGVASFDYTITDGNETDTANVTVNVGEKVVLYRVNAGPGGAGAGATTVAATDGGPDWIGDHLLTGTGKNGALLSGQVNKTFSNALTNQKNEINLDNLDTIVPWELFVYERWDNDPVSPTLDYSFAVDTGNTYEVTIYYTENFQNAFTQNPSRIFDVSVEGSVPDVFNDIKPLREAVDFVDGPGAPLPTFSDGNKLAKDPYLGVAFSRTHTFTATDDTLNLSFLHNDPVSQNPKVNAIEISQLGGPVNLPKPEINIISGNEIVNEDEGTIRISLLSSFTVPNNETVNIVFKIASVDATPGAGGDYEYTGGGTFGGGTYIDTVSIAGGSADVQIPIKILQDSDQELPETFTVTITSVSGNATIGANSQATITIKDDDTVVNPGDVVYRINAGGPEVAANDGGSNWEADQAAVGLGSAIAGDASQYLVDRGIDGTTVPTSDNNAFGSNTPISPSANTTDAPNALFTTERFSTLVNPDNIGYAFPVINGDYLVNLYFYELFFTTAGSRIFDVEIEDTLVLDDFDTVATFGNKSGVQSFATTVNDGVLNLEFLKAAANNPHIAAIEIIAADGQPTTPISIFIEAEDISNVTGYRLEGKSAASGGQMLSLIGSGGEETGTATFTFTGPTGSYNINLGTFDESDGEASFTVQQSGVKIGKTIVLDQNKTGGAGANTSTKVTRLVGSGIELINGATITITGLENGREHARFDFVEFTTASGTTPTPPLASNDAFITDEDNPVSGSVLANDTTTLPLTVLEVNGSSASVGTQITLSSGALLTVNPDGTFNYDPNGAFDDLATGKSGTETFTYLAGNSQGVSEATATVTINGITPPPTGLSFGQQLLKSLNASDGIATGGSYASGAVGSVELSVMANVNTIQSSNFAKGSFQLTNTGDKKIAAFFIDFRDAVFGDSVVDFDGSGGDTTFKKFAVDNGGTNGSETGVFFDSNDGKVYYLPGEPPLSNNTGTGIPSSGGFRGLLLKAGNTGNGFETGETAGFSGDMDPNSIAGLLKRNRNNTVGVDVGAIGNWDIGGVSGAEIAGSRFFVRFDDGTTASGVLANNDTQAGSVGQAVQGRAEIPVDVIVNSGSGKYGNGVEPTIVVKGPAGQTVKVVLAKGLQPVTNDRNGYEKLVEDRLALSQPDFQVNNSFDFQEVIVTIGSNGTVTLPSGAFDYSGTKSGVQFSGDDVAPIAISAVAVDVANLPIGPVDREYLTNPTQTPVVPIATDSSGYFKASSSGSDLYFKIQIEDAAAPNGGTSPNGKWNYVTAPDSQGRQTGFQGTGYYVYGSNTSTGISQVNENEILKFEIEVPQAMVGRTVFFRTRASRDGVAAGDQQNDLWVNVAPKNGTGSIEDLLVRNGTNEAEPVSGEFIKVYGGPNNGTWGYAGLVDGAPNNFKSRIAFPEAGRYVLEIAGRSQGFHLDFIELFTGSIGSGAANSAFVSTGSQQVQLASEIPDQGFTGGTTDTFDMLTGTFFDPNGDPVTDQASVTAANDSDVSGVAIDEITGQTSGLSTLAIAPYQPDADGAAANAFEIGIVDENTLQTLVAPVGAASNDFEYLGSSGINASTSISPTVATGIGLTAEDITTVNGFEDASEHARFNFL